MQKYSSKKGNNMVEYVLTSILVGVVGGYSMLLMNPDLFKNVFRSTFSSQSAEANTITIGPIGETIPNTANIVQAP